MRKYSAWRRRMMELSVREKYKNYLWISVAKDGSVFTYVKSKHGELR
jgi:hypothetical protein